MGKRRPLDIPDRFTSICSGRAIEAALPRRLAEGPPDRRGVRLIFLTTVLFYPLYINIVIAELPKEGSSDADIEPRTRQFGALLIRPPHVDGDGIHRSKSDRSLVTAKGNTMTNQD